MVTANPREWVRILFMIADLDSFFFRCFCLCFVSCCQRMLTTEK